MFPEIINIKSNDITRENANINADTPAGMMMKFASETTKPFVDDYLLSEEVLDAVSQNYLHIHDKDYYPTRSRHAYSTRWTASLHTASLPDTESRALRNVLKPPAYWAASHWKPPKTKCTADKRFPRSTSTSLPTCGNSFIEEVKNLEELNGEDYSHLYRKELTDYQQQPLDGLTGEQRIIQHAVNKTVARVHQSMEAFIHNMNTIHSRGGNQVVFSSINYGTDTSAEGRCIIRELLKSTYQGVGNGENGHLPHSDMEKETRRKLSARKPGYDLYQLACKVTARRFFPNFLNLDATFNQSDDWKADDPKRYEHEVAAHHGMPYTRIRKPFFGPNTSIGRGNLSFSTINIVRLAIECMGITDKEQRIARFFAKLDAMLDITARQLHERMEFQKTAFAKQFPLLMSALWIGCDKLKPNDDISSVINQGTLGIGFIGLAECLVALLGKHHGESEEAQELELIIVTYMRDRANQFSDQYQHNYSVLATPAEGLSGKFTRVDRKKFGCLPGITDRDYYTNSNHVPVYYKCSARHKAEIEGPYHDRQTRGGHIFYVEIDGDATHNPEVIMRVVDMMDRYNIGYGSVNHNRNRCLDCGYENSTVNLEACPKCGSTHIDKLQRITGYLVGTTPPEPQAEARRAERQSNP